MQYYQEITLIPDAEISVNFLWTKVFTQLHIAFADRLNRTGTMDLAVSFPEYQEHSLGSKIRLIAESQETLEAFAVSRILSRYADYVHFTGIRPVRENRISGWAVYSRWQPKGALPGRARRYAKRHADITYEEALQLLKQKKTKNYPPLYQNAEPDQRPGIQPVHPKKADGKSFRRNRQRLRPQPGSYRTGILTKIKRHQEIPDFIALFAEAKNLG